MKNKLNLKSIPILVTVVLSKLVRYRVLVFGVVLVAVYGYVVLQIQTLSNAEPSTTTVSGELNTVRPPHVDKTVVEQLQALQDNSVSVKTLFNQARDNPFQE